MKHKLKIKVRKKYGKITFQFFTSCFFYVYENDGKKDKRIN